MNSFGPGMAGGGNAGFAVSLYTAVSGHLASSDAVHFSCEVSDLLRLDYELLVRHVIAVWREFGPTNGGFDVTIKSVAPPHVGLGSSAALQMAVLLALNMLVGSPLSVEELRQILARQYKEASGGILTDGFTTGLASFLGLHGGFAIIGNDLAPLAHLRMPCWTAVLAVQPRLRGIAHGESELSALMNDGRAFDREARERKAAILWQELVPALECADLHAAGTAIWRLQQVGSKRAEVALHGDALYDAMNQLRCDGIPVVFMSAVGPGVVLISNDSLDNVKNILTRRDFLPLAVGTIDANGAQLGCHYFA